MTEPDPFTRLLVASRDLLDARYRDGEVDAVALTKFAIVVEDVDPHRGHRLTVNSNSPETFLPRRGCLDCNVWIDLVRLRAK